MQARVYIMFYGLDYTRTSHFKELLIDYKNTI